MLIQKMFLAMAECLFLAFTLHGAEESILIEKKPPASDQEFVVWALACESAEIKFAERALKQTRNTDLFVPGATAAVTAMEFEPGGVHDLQQVLERLVPAKGDYEHNRLNHDSNSHSHIRAAIVGPSETMPVHEGRLVRGTWQQIVLLDFDDRPRERRVSVQVLA